MIHCRAFGENVGVNNLPAKFCEVRMGFREIDRRVDRKCSFVVTETRVQEMLAELEKAHSIMLKLEGKVD
jgi:hypothetical protein